MSVIPFIVASVACAAVSWGQSGPGTTPFVLDGNRVYAEVEFVRPDRSVHRALLFVDMGSPQLSVVGSLFTDLQLDRGAALRFRVGGLLVEVPARDVTSESGRPRSVGPGPQLEGVLPARLLQHHLVVIDYKAHTLSLLAPGSLAPTGTPVPFRMNERTGLISVDATVDGKQYPLTIDNGSAYSWVARTVAAEWLTTHADWQRAVGAVGPSNMMMSGDSAETAGVLMRVPSISLGPLTLTTVGVLGVGPDHLLPRGQPLFEWYSAKNAGPVVGWVGGNVLKQFRLTIDYENRMLYWQTQAPPDTTDLTRVGVVLRRDTAGYLVAAVASKDGHSAVDGVQPGDRLLRIGDLDTNGATLGAVFEALRGRAGETRALLLEREGRTFMVSARITAF